MDPLLLALLSVVTFGASELSAYQNCIDRTIALFLIGFTLLLLSASADRFFLAIAVVLLLLGLSSFALRNQRLTTGRALLAERYAVGSIHLVACCILPIVVLWHWAGVYGIRSFFRQEFAHLFGGITIYTVLVLGPLFLLQSGISDAISLQMFESISMILIMAPFLLGYFALSIYSGHINRMDNVDFDHVVVYVVVLATSATSFLYGRSGVRCTIHILAPALCIVHNMGLSHVHAYTYNPVDSDEWMQYSAKMHILWAVSLAVGAVCRAIGKTPESTFFFFVSAFIFPFSSRNLAIFLSATFHNGQLADLIIAGGCALFPLHYVVLANLRKFLGDDGSGPSRKAEATYRTLPTIDHCDCDGDDDVKV